MRKISNLHSAQHFRTFPIVVDWQILDALYLAAIGSEDETESASSTFKSDHDISVRRIHKLYAKRRECLR